MQIVSFHNISISEPQQQAPFTKCGCNIRDIKWNQCLMLMQCVELYKYNLSYRALIQASSNVHRAVYLDRLISSPLSEIARQYYPCYWAAGVKKKTARTKSKNLGTTWQEWMVVRETNPDYLVRQVYRKL